MTISILLKYLQYWWWLPFIFKKFFRSDHPGQLSVIRAILFSCFLLYRQHFRLMCFFCIIPVFASWVRAFAPSDIYVPSVILRCFNTVLGIITQTSYSCVQSPVGIYRSWFVRPLHCVSQPKLLTFLKWCLILREIPHLSAAC